MLRYSLSYRSSSNTVILVIVYSSQNTDLPIICLQLAEILHETHGVDKVVAADATTTYLRKFRRCPDNPNVPLDEWRMLLWSESLPDSLKFLTKTIYENWLQLRYHYLKLTPDLINLLRGLNQRYLMALITNGESNAQWEKINMLNIEKYFDLTLVSGDLPWEKPCPEIFQSACNYLGVPPGQSAMVGDKLETDIKVCSLCSPPEKAARVFLAQYFILLILYCLFKNLMVILIHIFYFFVDVVVLLIFLHLIW